LHTPPAGGAEEVLNKPFVFPGPACDGGAAAAEAQAIQQRQRAAQAADTAAAASKRPRMETAEDATGQHCLKPRKQRPAGKKATVAEKTRAVAAPAKDKRRAVKK
jgi:hypothetical protein